MSVSEVPLVVLTACQSIDKSKEDDLLDDITLADLPGNEEVSARCEPPQSSETPLIDCDIGDLQKHRRVDSVRSEGPPSYQSIFTDDRPKLEKTRLIPPSAREAFHRLSDVWNHGTARNSMSSIYPESPTSITTLSGFIIRDKNGEGETHVRQQESSQWKSQEWALIHSWQKQVFRLAAVLLVCGTSILILECLTLLLTDQLIPWYSYAGISAGILISFTGILGIFGATRKDCPQKYFSYYKGLSLLCLLLGVVVLCAALASLDVRWVNKVPRATLIAEEVLFFSKVLLAGVDIAVSLASIYI